MKHYFYNFKGILKHFVYIILLINDYMKKKWADYTVSETASL